MDPLREVCERIAINWVLHHVPLPPERRGQEVQTLTRIIHDAVYPFTVQAIAEKGFRPEVLEQYEEVDLLKAFQEVESVYRNLEANLF